MNLFLNAISESWSIILFDDKKEIVLKKDIEVFWNESEKLIDIFDMFLAEQNLSYNDLENIVVVVGPGSFTGVRTVCLFVNTINFVTKKNLTPISFFDLYSSYPIIKTCSKRDSFFKKDKKSKIEAFKNGDILNYLKENKIKYLYWENPNLITRDISQNQYFKILENIDYHTIIKNIKLEKLKSVKPLHIKKPSIS